MAVLVQQIDFTTGKYQSLFPLVEDIRHRGEKWAKSSETRGVGLRILSLTLARAPPEQFKDRVGSYLKKLLKKAFDSSDKNDALVALLDLLRGAYIPTEFGWTPGM